MHMHIIPVPVPGPIAPQLGAQLEAATGMQQRLSSTQRMVMIIDQKARIRCRIQHHISLKVP